MTRMNWKQRAWLALVTVAGLAFYGGISGAWAQSDCSLGLTTGGTAQNILAASGARKTVTIANPDVETETLYVALDGTATVTVAATSGSSFSVLPGGILMLPDPYAGSRISVIAATSGHRIVCKYAN